MKTKHLRSRRWTRHAASTAAVFLDGMLNGVLPPTPGSAASAGPYWATGAWDAGRSPLQAPALAWQRPRRIDAPPVGWWTMAFALLALLGAAVFAVGAEPAKGSGLLGFGKPNKTLDSYPTIGDYTAVDGMLPIKVEGIGLVVSLKGTGSDPQPNNFRDQMLEEMRKREVLNPNEILSSPDTAVVLLRAYLPPGVRKGEPIDVEVWVPPGDETTSLRGGRLLEATLFENMIARGKIALRGEGLVRVEGPVLVAAGSKEADDSPLLKKGKVVGQGIAMIDRNFRLAVSKEDRSGRRIKLLTQRINGRMFAARNGRRVGMASAHDEKVVDLELAPPYRFNIERYLLVVRRIPISNNKFNTAALDELQDQLLQPKTTLEAALRLEALGSESISVLKKGLDSQYEFVRFTSAEALCYLNDAAGANELLKLAEEAPNYRPYALSALVALDQPVSRMHLARLLQSESAELRYGAFRSLWAYDPQDPLLGGEKLGDGFHLHRVQSPASPMVHISRNFRREIVLFNPGQTLAPPFSLRAGDHLLVNAAADGGNVFLASIEAGPKGATTRRAESSHALDEILRHAIELGATYPDLVELLQQAKTCGALQARLEINALPRTLNLEALEAVALLDAVGDPKSSNRKEAIGGPGLFRDADEGPVRPRIADQRDDKDDAEPTAPVAKKRWYEFGLFGN
ncbi:MAG: flagellar basal body P-ring protein FlgI [Planctomycetia bacterium]